MPRALTMTIPRAVAAVGLLVVAATLAEAQNWPSFRGTSGSGVADGTNPPIAWDADKSTNVKWKAPIPGMGFSSPVIWGDRVFVTTAVPSNPAGLTFQYGQTVAGTGQTQKDDSYNSWRVYALDKQTGKILWERVTKEGIPRSQRHVNASQANSTPAVDGKHLVVWFGSEGIYCYDLNGKLLWNRDLGHLSSGWYYDPSYEWNTGSSPVIYKNTAILQIDLLKNSFLLALDLDTGKEVWRVMRDEIPSWGTPLVYEGDGKAELVTNAPNFARGYDPATGKELWRLGKQADINVPTPIAGRGLIYLTSAPTPFSPIYAVRPGASGDITLKDGVSSSAEVAWSKRRGGVYPSTPLLYGDLLYMGSNNGVLTTYKADTGERVYEQRIGGRAASYTASPVAADGRLYYTSEDGDVFVVKAGPSYELLSVNPMGEPMMATPAIAQGLLIFRTLRQVVAVGGRGADK